MINDHNSSPAWWQTTADSRASSMNAASATRASRTARPSPPRRGWDGDDYAAEAEARPGARRGGGNGRGALSVILALLVVAMVILGTLIAIKKNRGPNGGGSARYEAVTLARGNLRPTVTAIGNLKPLTEVTVGSEISGIIRKIYVKTNDAVQKDQLIAQIDTERLSQQVAAAEAAAALANTRVAEANATFLEAKVTYERKQDLFTKSQGRTPSLVEMETAKARFARSQYALEAAQSDANAAKAQERAVRADLEKTKILSPVNGIVLKSNFEEGATVAAGYRAPELFVIAEKLDLMKVVVSVSEADIARVQGGQKASFTVDAWGSKPYEATVTKVEKMATNTDNVITYDVEIQVPNTDLSLRSGMTATATIYTEEISGAWLVPTRALGFSPASGERREPRPGNAVLWVLDRGVPKAVEVRAGHSNAQNTEVISDLLADGMSVVVGEKFN